MKWFKRITWGCVVLLGLFGAAAYPYYAGKVDYFFLKRHIKIEVNGVVVPGEVLVGRFTALATRRDAGKQHSYLLLFAGDVDPEGNEGFAIDCAGWVAPRLPVLVETHSYPPCVGLAGKRSCRDYYQFKSSRQFKTAENDVIGFRTDKW
jgi:hypothetical protein